MANYLAFVASGEEWKIDVLDMRGQCEGVRSGEITEYDVGDLLVGDLRLVGRFFF